MEKQTKKGIILIFFGLMFLLGVIMVIIGYPSDEFYEEEVKCYDRYENEIEGLTCKSMEFNLSGLTISGVTISGVSFALFIMVGINYNTRVWEI